jgi:hypothetical protein
MDNNNKAKQKGGRIRSKNPRSDFFLNFTKDFLLTFKNTGPQLFTSTCGTFQNRAC